MTVLGCSSSSRTSIADATTGSTLERGPAGFEAIAVPEGPAPSEDTRWPRDPLRRLRLRPPSLVLRQCVGGPRTTYSRLRRARTELVDGQ